MCLELEREAKKPWLAGVLWWDERCSGILYVVLALGKCSVCSSRLCPSCVPGKVRLGTLFMPEPCFSLGAPVLWFRLNGSLCGVEGLCSTPGCPSPG